MTLDTEEELCFMVGRDGDSLATPFQCDKCHFHNILGRELVEGGRPSIRCSGTQMHLSSQSGCLLSRESCY